VYLVGAGPGDPGLLTLRGREVLASADVVIYDALAPARLLDYAPPDAERINAGKHASHHTLEQDKINRLLVDRALTGATVVRLKGGDPMVFGRGGEEALALVEAGIPFEIIPGVTAGVAAAAYAGIPVTHRGLASAVAFVTGHEADAKAPSTGSGQAGSALDWDALARWPGTLVFYMGVATLPAIAANLIGRGLAAETPAAVIHRGTTPRQKVVAGTLAALPRLAEEAGIGPPALLVVGRVVALRDPLAWFERRPLFGRRIVVTRARLQASALTAYLESLGAEVIEAPAIRLLPPEDPAPLREAARSPQTFDWIILTSARGVDALFDALAAEGLDARALAPCRVAAIGSATAAHLASRGIRADLVPETFTAAALIAALAARQTLAGVRVLLARADIAPKEPAEALAARGAIVREVVAYRTAADFSNADAVAAALERGEVDWLTFTSSSTVKNFLDGVGVERAAASRARIASIGPTTSQALRASGLEPTAEADPHTIPGLVEAILRHESQGNP